MASCQPAEALSHQTGFRHSGAKSHSQAFGNVAPIGSICAASGNRRHTGLTGAGMEYYRNIQLSPEPATSERIGYPDFIAEARANLAFKAGWHILRYMS